MSAGRRPAAGRPRAGMPVAVAVALACGALALSGAACGGSGGGGADGRAGDVDGAAGAFCEAYAGYQREFSGGASYDEVLAALRDLEPPPEVADDFDALTLAVEAVATVDQSDAAAVARFQATTSATAREANANIIEYVTATCPGFDAPAGIVPSTSGG